MKKTGRLALGGREFSSPQVECDFNRPGEVGSGGYYVFPNLVARVSCPRLLVLAWRLLGRAMAEVVLDPNRGLGVVGRCSDPDAEVGFVRDFYSAPIRPHERRLRRANGPNRGAS